MAPHAAVAQRARRRRHLAAGRRGPPGAPAAELDYAGDPHATRARAVDGALMATPDVDAPAPAGTLETSTSAHPLAVVRRLADGRLLVWPGSSVTVRRLICFDRTREYESLWVHLTGPPRPRRPAPRSGLGPPVDARGRGHLGRHRVVEQPLSIDLAARIAPYAVVRRPRGAERTSSSRGPMAGAGRVGATPLEPRPAIFASCRALGMAAAVEIPRLDLPTVRFAALLNALSQYDRGVLVDPAGTVSTVGVHLRSSERSLGRSARSSAPATSRRCGSPPTSRRRSSSWSSRIAPLSVFCRGERLDLS